MSDHRHHHHIEHKSLVSYIVGFLLSLIFTFIPYHLVVNHVLTGTDLLVTIMGFAVLQLIVQIVFFLHIGRGPKPKWNLIFFMATLSIILVVAGGSMIIMKNLHRKLPPEEQAKQLVDKEGIYQVGGQETGACRITNENHQITLQDGKIEPMMTIAEECDSVSFIDKDGAAHEIVFGSAKQKATYAGMDVLAVRKGHSKTIPLSEQGTFKFHDKAHPSVTAVLVVVEKNNE